MNRAFQTLLTLALIGCATEEKQGEAPLFSDGSPEELETAAAIGMEVLAGPEGLFAARGVKEARILKVHVDDLAMAHLRVQQTQGGVPVWGGEAIVHLDQKGNLFALTDGLVEGVVVDLKPAYEAEEAIDFAVEASVGWENLTDDPQADLWVFRDEAGEDHLTWRIQLKRIDGSEHTAMPVVFVDAHSGETVWAYENLQTATCNGATNFYGNRSFDCYSDGTSYYTEGVTLGNGTYSYGNTTSSLYYVSSTGVTFSTSAATTRNAVEAHWVSEQTLAYYLSTFGRDGMNGAGGPTEIASHGYDWMSSFTSYSSNYVNAFWDGTSMTYGDGDNYNSGPLTTLDIGGHEMTHGVTQFEANLTYSGEPGHLNEAYSDIFGAMVERSVLGESTNTWLVGEATWTPGTSGDALRYMNDPADDGYSRDYYSSGLGSVDVHYGSGIPNLAFYLLSEGGLHPRGKSTVNVTAIGADDAAEIWYLALTSYLTSSSNFSSARTAQINAATALFGATSQQVQSVTNSWAAVGVGSPYGSTGPSCTTTTYSGSISRSGRTAYAPSSSGLSAGSAPMTLTLTGPSGANFDLYLDKKPSRSWGTVATSATSGSNETISYTGTSGTYRARIYSASGTGSYTLTWCK